MYRSDAGEYWKDPVIIPINLCSQSVPLRRECCRARHQGRVGAVRGEKRPGELYKFYKSRPEHNGPAVVYQACVIR